MIFVNILNAYTLYEAKRKIKRYIVGASLWFGKDFKIPLGTGFVTILGKMPPGAKFRVFNSAKEAIAQASNNGKNEYVFVKVGQEIKNIAIESPTTLTNLMETDNIYQYLQKNAFVISFIYSGNKRYVMYHPKDFVLGINTTTDPDTFKSLTAAAAYEQAINEYVAKAQRNARVLAIIAKNKTKLSAANQDKLNQAIVNHQYEINSFKNSLPSGFELQTSSLDASKISGIGVLPVIVWVVGLIVTGFVVGGLVGYNMYLKAKTEVEKRKNVLDNNLSMYKQIIEVQSNPNLSPEAKQQITTAIMKTIESNNQALTTYANADAKEQESTGFTSIIKNALWIGGAVLIGKTLIQNKN